MEREAYGRGLKITRLAAITAGVVITIGVLIFGYLMIFRFPKEDAKSYAVLFTHEFYNHSDSSEACNSVPIVSSSYISSSNASKTSSLNSSCQAAHQSFISEYSNVSAVYVVDVHARGNLFSGITVRLDVVALDANGQVIEGLTEIKIKYENIDNPYYDYYEYYDDGEKERKGNGESSSELFPNFGAIEYGGDA